MTFSAKWISHFVKQGLSPGLVILEEVPFEQWQESERSWIAKLRAEGARLTNITEGGICGPRDEQTRAKISAAHKGKKKPPMTPETRAKIAAAKIGKKRGPMPVEWRAAIGIAHKDRQFSEEHRAKLSAAKMGHPVSPEARAKIAAGHVGKKASDETKAAMRERNLKRYADPEQRAKMAEAMKAVWAKRKAEKLDKVPRLFE